MTSRTKSGLPTNPVGLANLICCRTSDVLQQGDIEPFPNLTKCDAALRPTPLASLAAANTDNDAPSPLISNRSRLSITVVDWTYTLFLRPGRVLGEELL
jgi:hypothetical protein